MSLLFITRSFLLISILYLSSFSTLASIVINGTRVIYPAEANEISIKLDNKGEKPVLVQSWIDNGDPKANPSNIQVPFILTPPINRVNAQTSQTLRLSYTGDKLPKNKESIFWLNVLEIPAKTKNIDNKNQLQMAFRTRIKLFFRPKGLKGQANNAIKNTTWKKTTKGIIVNNPTPFYISLSDLEIKVKKKKYIAKKNDMMLSPNSSKVFYFIDIIDIPKNSDVIVKYINDYGATHKYTSKIN